MCNAHCLVLTVAWAVLSTFTKMHVPGVVEITIKTGSHPEMVGDMSRVTLNFDLSKIPFVHF